jgi:hypothetical protein
MTNGWYTKEEMNEASGDSPIEKQDKDDDDEKKDIRPKDDFQKIIDEREKIFTIYDTKLNQENITLMKYIMDIHGTEEEKTKRKIPGKLDLFYLDVLNDSGMTSNPIFMRTRQILDRLQDMERSYIKIDAIEKEALVSIRKLSYTMLKRIDLLIKENRQHLRTIDNLKLELIKEREAKVEKKEVDPRIIEVFMKDSGNQILQNYLQAIKNKDYKHSTYKGQFIINLQKLLYGHPNAEEIAQKVFNEQYVKFRNQSTPEQPIQTTMPKKIENTNTQQTMPEQKNVNLVEVKKKQNTQTP